MIFAMASKEQDLGSVPGWFHTRNAWLEIGQDEAENLKQLALDDPQEAVKRAWAGRWGKTSFSLARILGKNLEEIKSYPPFTWITQDGEIPGET